MPQLRTDSRAELLDYLKKYMQYKYYYIKDGSSVGKELQTKPEELSSEEFVRWFSQFKVADADMISILNQALQTALPLPEQATVHFESLTERYIKAVIAQDWQQVSAFHLRKCLRPELPDKDRLIRLVSANPTLRKTRGWSLINAGFSEDKQLAFVFAELTGKRNWTWLWAHTQDGWSLYESLNGTIQDFYARKRVYQDIAGALTLNKPDMYLELMDRAKDIYPFSPDIRYYIGLYQLGRKAISEAREAFLDAVTLDPGWQEPVFHLGLLEIRQQDYASALNWWDYLTELTPEDPRVWNNLGVCHWESGRKAEAKQAWQKGLQFSPDNELLNKNLERL